MLFQLTALTVVLFFAEDATTRDAVYPGFLFPISTVNNSLWDILRNVGIIPNKLNYKSSPKATNHVTARKSAPQLPGDARDGDHRRIPRQRQAAIGTTNQTEVPEDSKFSNPLTRDEVRELLDENEKQLKKVLKKSRWKEKVKTKLMNKYKEKQEREDDYQEQLNQLNKLYDLQNPQEEIEDAAHDAEIFRSIYTSVMYHQKTWAERFFKKFTRHRVKRDEEVICYKDLGCFRDEGPFDYLDMLPNSPEEINTMFLLHTKENPNREQLLSYSNVSSIVNSNFKATRKTKIIIHGFGSSCHRVWVREMRTTFLNMEDLNIICVDWENGASTPNYVRAASNTRLVGTQVAVFLEQVQLATNLSLSDVHLIGFSLGAHVSGYAGQKLKGIGRISGLDPAGPLFESFPPNMRLDASDANFVDVIHTNADSLLRGGLGAYDAMGHVDFYPNGGRVQKGCKNLFVGGVSDILWPNDGDGRYLCNHRRGYKYFMESVVPVCKFPAVACRDYDTFLKGDCFPCNENCGNMGYYADKSPGRGQLFLATRDVEPFCANQYKVEIWHSGGPPTTDSVATHGRFDITFAAHDGKNETINVTRDTGKKMEAGSRTVSIVVLHVALSIIANLHVQYTSYRGWISSGYNRWAIDKMSIMSTSGKIQSFCHRGLTMESGLTMLFPLVPGDCNPLDLTLHPLPVPWPGIDYNIQNGVHVFPHSTTTGSPIRIGTESSNNKNTTGSPLALSTEGTSVGTQPTRGTPGSLSTSFSVIYSDPGAHSNHTKIETITKNNSSKDSVKHNHELTKGTFGDETGLILSTNKSDSSVMSTDEYLAWINAPPPNIQKPHSTLIPALDGKRNPTPKSHGSGGKPSNTQSPSHHGQQQNHHQNNQDTRTDKPKSSNPKPDNAILTFSRYPAPNGQGEGTDTKRPTNQRQEHKSNEEKRKEGSSNTNDNNYPSKIPNWKPPKDSMIREDAQVKDINEELHFTNGHQLSQDSSGHNSQSGKIFPQINGQDLFSAIYDHGLKIPVDFDLNSNSKVAEEPSFNSVVEGEVPFKERARAIKFDTPLQLTSHHQPDEGSKDESKSKDLLLKQFVPDSPSTTSRGKPGGAKNDFPHSSQNFNSDIILEQISPGHYNLPPLIEKSESPPYSYEQYTSNGEKSEQHPINPFSYEHYTSNGEKSEQHQINPFSYEHYTSTGEKSEQHHINPFSYEHYASNAEKSDPHQINPYSYEQYTSNGENSEQPYSYEQYSSNGPPLPPQFGIHTLPPTVLKPPRIDPNYGSSPENEDPLHWSPPSVRYYSGPHATPPESFQSRHRYFPRPPIGFQNFDESEHEFGSASSYTHAVGSQDPNSPVPHFRSQSPFHFQQFPPTIPTRPPKASTRPFPLSLLSFGTKGEGSSFSHKRDKNHNSESRLPRLFPFLASRFSPASKRYSLPTHLRAPPQNQNAPTLSSHVATRRKGVGGDGGGGGKDTQSDNSRRLTKGSKGAAKRQHQPSNLSNSFSSRSLPVKSVSIQFAKGRSGEENLKANSYKRSMPHYTQGSSVETEVMK